MDSPRTPVRGPAQGQIAAPMNPRSPGEVFHQPQPNQFLVAPLFNARVRGLDQDRTPDAPRRFGQLQNPIPNVRRQLFP